MTNGWLRRRSIRFRLTVLASVVVAVVLVGSAVGLVVLQSQQLQASFDASLRQRADTIVASMDTAIAGGVIPNSNDEDQAAQLVADRGGTKVVLASSTNLDGVAPLRVDGDPMRDSFLNREDLPLPEAEYRVYARRVETSSGPASLYVIESTDDLGDTIHRLVRILAVTVPLTIFVMAILMWWLIGRSLRPVEQIRAEVAQFSGTDLDHRVEVPDRDDEISRLAVTMNAMLDRIGTATERERRFVADASHELRTPLTRIRTAVEVDTLHPDAAVAEETNQLVLEETVALQRLVEDLLYLARSDAGALAYRPEPVDLDDVVLDEVAHERAHSGTHFDLGDVSAAHIVGDRDQLARLVRNLLTNATRHAATEVVVSLREVGDQVELVIADDGPGVPAELATHIFERFTRVDADRGATSGGTGLGLAIAGEIVEQHGGTISLADEWRSGARFVVTLPAGTV